MQKEIQNPVNAIRSMQRSELEDMRNKNKEIILHKKRLSLCDASEYTYDVSITEFQGLLLKLKQKNVPLEVLKKIKNSCVSYEYIEVFFRSDGALNSLVRILSGNNARKQLEAAACLTNLACGPHKCSYKIAKATGAYLISFINGSSYFLQDQSAWAVGNIANDCLECFNYIKAQGILPALFKALGSPLPSVVESVVFALNACTKYGDSEVISLIQSGLLQNLLCFIKQENTSTKFFLDVAFTLSNCCFISVKYSLDVLDVAQQILCVLTNIIHRKDANILMATPLVRCLGFLSYRDEICKALSVHLGFIESVQVIFAAEGYMNLKKELIWVLSNIIVSESLSNMNTYLLPTFDVLKTILKTDETATLQVLYYLSCLTTSDESIASELKQHEIFSLFQCLLTREETDISHATSVLFQILEGQ